MFMRLGVAAALAAALLALPSVVAAGSEPGQETAAEPDDDTAVEGARPAPDFPSRSRSRWINSPPLTMADLRGRVVLLNIWTFG